LDTLTAPFLNHSEVDTVHQAAIAAGQLEGTKLWLNPFAFEGALHLHARASGSSRT
jgi:hypothetical protein